MQTAHCLFHIDIEQVGEREGHCQQRLPSLPMSHLLVLVVDTVAYKYLSIKRRVTRRLTCFASAESQLVS